MEPIRKILELALAVVGTGCAVARNGWRAAAQVSFCDTCAVARYWSLPTCRDAAERNRMLQAGRARFLPYPHTAGAVYRQLGMIAESGHFHAGFADQLKQIFPRFLSLREYRQLLHNRLSSTYPLFISRNIRYADAIDLNGHTGMQASHLMHLLWSITCGSFTLPEIAPTGQTSEHFVHPHVAGSISDLHQLLCSFRSGRCR